MSVIAAMLVLFTAMLDPIVSVMLAVACLIGFAVYKLVIARRPPAP